MNAADLSLALEGACPPLLLHVTSEEHFAARHIEGAKNACVYETAFVNNVRGLAPDFSMAIVVYGEGAPFLDSEEAAGQLRAAGYTKVSDFRGGLRAWAAEGRPIVSVGPLPSAPRLEGTFLVDPAASVIRWTGRNLFNHHQGSLRLADGAAVFEDGVLRRAGFTIDLGSIVCEDLTDPGYHELLVRHLRSADFFDAERFPTARFETTRVNLRPDFTDGRPNYEIVGDLTLRGVAREITFPAVVAAPDGEHVVAQAVLEIDRTRWGSHYGSGRFFAFLGKHVVNDDIALHLKIHAGRVSQTGLEPL